MVSLSNPESDESDRGNSALSEAQDRLPETALLINRQRAVQANWGEVQDFLGNLSLRLARSSFSVCLLSDRGIRRYNKRFRHQDEATDVLSFPAAPPGDEPQGYLGDILISAETARENAKRFGLRIEEEIKVLALHGLLHLMGYDHGNDGGRMARLERRWSAKLGLPQNLVERSHKPFAGGIDLSGQHR